MKDSDNGSAYMRSGQLARLAGVSTDTLRYYERRGVLPRPRRSPNGYREYPAALVRQVELIRRAISIGFSVEELARILRVRSRGGVPCREVRNLAAAKLKDVESQLRQISFLRRRLRALLQEWDRRLAATPPDRQARLLELL